MPIKTIALLAGTVQDPYGGLCIEEYLSVVRKRKARLVVYANCSPGVPSPTVSRGWRDAIFEPERYDGLIILGSLCHGLDSDSFGAWCRSFATVPTVTVSVEVPGLHSVVSETAPGLRSLVAHLADDHGYRDFALVCGPSGQIEAEDRKSVVMEALHERGISIDPASIAHGDYSRESGSAAMLSILSARPTLPRAVMCMNDDMARGAREALVARGRSVPGDVAVTGFDDFHSDGLCTVSQALREQSRRAAELLFDLIDGKQAPCLVRVPSVLVRRGSCGCVGGSLGTREVAPQLAPAPWEEGGESALSFSYRRRARELIKAAVELLDPGSEDDVFLVLARHLPELGISRCWLSLPSEAEEEEGQLVLRLAMGASGRIPSPPKASPSPPSASARRASPTPTAARTSSSPRP
jgi:DNA-binding LacI/PurR family transcriptional regulator